VEAQALRETITNLLGLYRRLHFGRAWHQVVSIEKLRSTNLLMKIARKLLSVTGTALYSSHTSYALHSKAEGRRIVVVFIDDEPEKLQKALAAQDEA
jgi:hypothetical protein